MQWRGEEQRRRARRLDVETKSGLLRHRWEARQMQQTGFLKRLWQRLRGKGPGAGPLGVHVRQASVRSVFA